MAKRGRPPGSLNKATADIKAYASQYSQEAIDRAVKIMRSAESEQACMAAVNSILDRAHGKPAIQGPGEKGEHKIIIGWEKPSE